MRVDCFYSNDYIEYESNGGKNKFLSVQKYIDEIKQNLKRIISHLKLHVTLKFQLTITISFVLLSKGTDKVCIIHSKCDNRDL